MARLFIRKQAYNKAFKSDSQRLAVSLRSSIAKRRSHLNAALAYMRKYKFDYQKEVEMSKQLSTKIRKLRLLDLETVSYEELLGMVRELVCLASSCLIFHGVETRLSTSIFPFSRFKPT